MVTASKIDFTTSKACVLRKSASQSTAAGSVITFPSEIFDPYDWHNNSTNTSRITVGEAGVYTISCFLRWNDDTTGTYRIISIVVNGTEIVGTSIAKDANGRASGGITISVNLNVNDYVEVMQTNNGTPSLITNNHFFSVQKIGQ